MDVSGKLEHEVSINTPSVIKVGIVLLTVALVTVLIQAAAGMKKL